jgi:hypothetical protein
MEIHAGAFIQSGNLPTPVKPGSYTRLATDEYGKLYINRDGENSTVNTSLTSGVQKTQIVDSTLTGSVSLYNVVSGTYAIKSQEVLIPGAEDNTNNVFHCSEKPLSGSVNALSNYSTTSLVTNGVIKNTAGKLFKISGYLQPSDSTGATHFLQLFNSTAVPADTTVPQFVRPIVAASNTVLVSFEYEFAVNFGRYFDTGMCWAVSSTGPSKTLTTGSTSWVQATYV